MIGAKYGCLRCASAFTVVRGVIALFGDRRRDLVRQSEPSPEANGEPPRPHRREVPVKRDVDMPWDRARR